MTFRENIALKTFCYHLVSFSSALPNLSSIGLNCNEGQSIFIPQVIDQRKRQYPLINNDQQSFEHQQNVQRFTYPSLLDRPQQTLELKQEQQANLYQTTSTNLDQQASYPSDINSLLQGNSSSQSLSLFNKDLKPSYQQPSSEECFKKPFISSSVSFQQQPSTGSSTSNQIIPGKRRMGRKKIQITRIQDERNRQVSSFGYHCHIKFYNDNFL